MSQLTEAVQGASECGFCHTDIRPENIVVLHHDHDQPVQFQLIDWGLAIACNAMFPESIERTAKLYFASAILNNDCEEIQYVPEYDKESIEYIAYAFVLGGSGLSVPWDNLSPQSMVVRRRREMSVDWRTCKK